MATFRIHEDNIERLEHKLTRIHNKCIKYGCDFSYSQVGEEFVEVESEGEKSIQRYVIVEAEGTAVINGWKFVATIDHSNEHGNILRKISDDVEIPDEYRTCEPKCEHCNSKRHRKDTYIVYNMETDEFKQVGSSCLCDFTGGYSAELAASYIAMFDALIQGEAPSGGFRCDSYWSVNELIRYAVDIINHLGYVPTSAAEFGMTTTRAEVVDAILYDTHRGRLHKSDIERIESYRETYHPDYTSKELNDSANDIINYIKAVDSNSDYLHNLKVIAESDYIPNKNVGYCVSMVSYYRKQMGILEAKRVRNEAHAKEVAESDYISSEGQRITISNISSYEVVTSWQTDYGITHRYKIVDTNGNVIMWDTSNCIYGSSEQQMDGTFRNLISITGTVKKLSEFNGVKQTWITRCRIKYSDPIEQKGESSDNDVIEAIGNFIDYVNS